ncbi:MAG TPA: TMEM175 family protein [Blastocatellia bacterium]|nr:TMEM175 family protein [Blastocatellia bacterium]
MLKGRLEAFSDCVFSIIITVMLLNLKVPQTSDFHGLIEVLPFILAYALSVCHMVRTTRNCAFPLSIRAYPSAAFASG